MNNDLISRSALLDLAHSHVGGTVDCNDIARFPAVDVEVVRCHDCIHGRTCRFDIEEPETMICVQKNMFPLRTNPGFYCAHGEYKKDAEWMRMSMQELETIERIYATCKAINKQLDDAGFESVDAALEEIRSLREELEHQENYLEFYKGISSDALSTCRELTDYIKRNNIPKNERISEIINTTKSRTYQVPEEIGVPYIVVCSKGTWFSHEYANCDHLISPLMIQMKGFQKKEST